MKITNLRISWALCGVCSIFLFAATHLVAGEFKPVPFSELAAMEYNPEPPESQKKKLVRSDRKYLEEVVPESVLAMNHKQVEIAGYMLPLSVEGEKVREFLLMPDTGSCCYGIMPAFNGFVFAKAKKGVNLFDNIPIRIRGELEVQEVWQSGFFSHLYYVEVEEVVLGFGGQSPQGAEIGL